MFDSFLQFYQGNMSRNNPDCCYQKETPERAFVYVYDEAHFYWELLQQSTNWFNEQGIDGIFLKRTTDVHFVEYQFVQPNETGYLLLSAEIRKKTIYIERMKIKKTSWMYSFTDEETAYVNKIIPVFIEAIQNLPSHRLILLYEDYKVREL